MAEPTFFPAEGGSYLIPAPGAQPQLVEQTKGQPSGEPAPTNDTTAEAE